MQVKGNQYIYTDISGLNDLKTQARTNQQSAIRDVAKQFEGLFMNMMLKSMRDASMGDPIFDSNQSMMYRDMFDRQLALSMSKGQGMGLADILERQLAPQIMGAAGSQQDKNAHMATQVVSMNEVKFPAHSIKQAKPLTTSFPSTPKLADSAVIGVAKPKQTLSFGNANSPQEKFFRELWPMAEEAADELDTLPEMLIAQAALETGWGKYVSKDKDGNSSYNLFNIKAGSDWKGKTIEKTTIEIYNGIPVKEVAKFRAYDSYEESFQDYVDFLKSNERYSKALSQPSDPEKFIRDLHQAGYATDPAYADKILNILNREWDVINTTIALYEAPQANA